MTMNEIDRINCMSEACQERLNKVQKLHDEMRELTNRLIDIKAEVDRIALEIQEDK